MIQTIKRTSNKWTENDRKVLQQYVERYPSNLKVAFEKAAENLNRTKQAVSVYYYNYFRKNVNVFTMTTKSYKSKNVKNERKLNVESTDLVELVSTLMNKLTNNQKIEVIKNIKF